MRYIRTNYGRIIDTNNFEVKREIYENGELKFYEYWTTRFRDREVMYLGANEITKQADTIEELCDELVYIKENSVEPEQMYPPLMNIQAIIETRKLLVCSEEWLIENFYYGIWTDKGLIYVAKMNDKGELELL